MSLRTKNLLACLLLGAACVLAAAPAWASRVVDVRVGRHPTFTRVVFELDAPAGYHVSRDPGGNALVVTLQASARAEAIPSSSVVVDTVDVREGSDRAVVRIGLRQSDVRIKEMLLANPPRIVLDIATPAMLARAEEKKPALPPAGEKRERPAVKTEAVAAESKAKPLASEPPAARVVAEGSKPAPAPESKPSIATAKPPTTTAPTPALKPAPEVVVEDIAPPRIAPPAPEIARPAPPPAPKPPVRAIAKNEAKKPEPAPVTEALPFDPSDPKVLGAAAAVLLAVVGAAVFMLRRRRAVPEEIEPLPFADDEGDDASGGFAMGSQEPAMGSATTDIFSESGPAGGSLFDDEESDNEKEESQMEQPMSGMGMGIGTSEAPMAFGGDGDASVVKLVRELERRVAQVEARLEESSEARERLERQVAAQSEELRVQRAAIARTQRALRSLSRSDEEQATEPALRDPSKTIG